VARFDGKTVLVTGSSKGVGLAAAERFAKLGAKVGLVARDRSALEAAAARIGGQTHIVAADLAEREECLRTVDEVVAALGPIDVLVSAAGTLQRDWVEDVKPADFDRNWRLHVGAALWLTQRVLPGMRERGSGSLVYVASELGLIGGATYASYCTSKWGLVGLGETLYNELGGSGVHVAVICPGDTRTDQFREDFNWGPTAGGIPFEKAMAPEKVARAIARCAEGRGKALVIVDRSHMRLLFAVMGGPRGVWRRGVRDSFKNIRNSRTAG
jgi:short-subunit dehydrogenase